MWEVSLSAGWMTLREPSWVEWDTLADQVTPKVVAVLLAKVREERVTSAAEKQISTTSGNTVEKCRPMMR